MFQKRQSEGYAIVILLLVFASLIVIFTLTLKNRSVNLRPVVDQVSKVFITPTPTPFPFQELTIPYLRNRDYQSSLLEPENIGENSNYTSYLTSFDSDGLRVYGLLTIPKGKKPDGGWPTVVFVHGYIRPESYKTTSNYVSWIGNLAAGGFVVFKIDLRGHGESEGEPGGGYYSADYVIDTLNAVSALQSTDFVNPNAIGLWGHSMAGNVVLRALAAKPDIQGAVIWAGAGYTYSDLQDFRIQDNSYKPPPPDSERAKKRQALRDAYGDFSPDNWFWKQVPATNYLEDIQASIQIHHAVDDNVVSIDYSRNLISILDKTQITHELHEYPSGGHNLTGTSFTRALETTSEFFKKHL